MCGRSIVRWIRKQASESHQGCELGGRVWLTNGLRWWQQLELDPPKKLVSLGINQIPLKFQLTLWRKDEGRQEGRRKCEGRKRDEFLERLFDWMSLSVANTSSLGVPYSLNSEPDLSLNQRLAKWQFIALDVNRNGVGVLWISISQEYTSSKNCKSDTCMKSQIYCVWKTLLYAFPIFSLVLFSLLVHF